MEPKLSHHFGLSWAKSFLKHHHKQLKAIFPQTVAEEWVISKKVITEWFEKHQELLESIDLRFLSNFDETMVAPGTQKFQVISPHDKKRVVKKVIQNKEHITLLQFIWADGSYSVPGVVLPLKNWPPLSDKITKSFHWSGQVKGWINEKIFYETIKKVFLPDLEQR